MLFVPGTVALVLHCTALLVGGFFSPQIFTALGDSDKGSDVSSKNSLRLFALGISVRFYPTFVGLSLVFTWISAAYEHEAGAYVCVCAPIGYAVIFTMLWLCFEPQAPGKSTMSSTNDIEFYEINATAAQSILVGDLQAGSRERAASPYLEERRHDEEMSLARTAIQRLDVERQHRMNRAFEDYADRVQRGFEMGPFIFEGEVIPIE